ncbi:MAG: HAD family hydrolase [Planctomycetota bacterium]|nr:HAD family hydrolase [Planctomycetota bacterium]
MSLLFLALHHRGRLAGAFLSPAGGPVLFLDVALAAVVCQTLGVPRRRSLTTGAPLLGHGVALGAATLAGSLWFVGGSPLVAVEAALTVLILSDPLLVDAARTLAWQRIQARKPPSVAHLSAGVLLSLARLERILLARRGVLTGGRPVVREVLVTAEGRSEEEILRLAAACEFGVKHPLRHAILGFRDLGGGTIPSVKGFEHVRGQGVRALLQGRKLLSGNLRLLRENGWDAEVLAELEDRSRPCRERGDTVIYVAHGGTVLGLIACRDELRPEAAGVARELRERGVRVGVVSGDDPLSVARLCRTLGPVEVFSRELPAPAKRAELEAVVAAPGNPALDPRHGRLRIEWPSEEPSGAAADASSSHGDVVLEKPDLGALPRLVDLGRSLRRERLLRSSAALLYQLLCFAVVAGALPALTGWRPSPVLAVVLFLAGRRLFGSERGSGRDIIEAPRREPRSRTRRPEPESVNSTP